MAMRRQRQLRKVRTEWVISDENGGCTWESPLGKQFYILQLVTWHSLSSVQVPKCLLPQSVPFNKLGRFVIQVFLGV